MSLFSPEEIERGLVAQGVPLHQARAAAHGGAPRTIPSNAHTFTRPEPLPPEIVWPFRLTLPWSHLCSDDAKYAPALRGTKPVMLLKPEYRRAMGLTADAARNALGIPSPSPAAMPLTLEAAVWVPDNRIHDVPNFAKCAHDALQGLVYTKDAWLHGAHWYRAGVDVDAPRAEITIRPIAA